MLYKKGLHEEALIELHESLAIRREFRGKNHESTANNYEMIGCILVEQRRNDDAVTGYSKALSMRIKLFGADNNTDTARGYFNIGDVQIRKFQHKEALDSFPKFHTFYKRELGDAHPDTLNAVNYLKNAESHQKRRKRAVFFNPC